MKTHKQSLTKNFFFQFAYQIVALVIPLLIAPHLTRTLMETSLGIHSYVQSIAYYFIIAANLGIGKHGARVISQNSGNELELRKSFWSLFSLHTLTSVISVVAYLVFIGCFVQENKSIYYINLLYVLSALFDLTWVFHGLENFRSVVIKNTIVKTSECVLIFLLIHTPDDLWKYTLITAGGLLAGQVAMLPEVYKQIKPIKFNLNDMKIHVKPILLFSITVIASTLYTTFDRTLLGLMTNKENVAFYGQANTIVVVPRSIVSVIGTIMFPRACLMAAQGKVKEQKYYMDISFFFAGMVGIGSMFGIWALGEWFAVVYYGEAFRVCGMVMKALSPIAFIIGFGDIVRGQYLIPNGLDKQYSVCIVLNAIINLILTVLLIPIWGIYGAVIGTVSAELFGLCYQLYLCRNFIGMKSCLNNTLPFVAIGMLMYAFLEVVERLMPRHAIGLIISIACGVVFYLVMTLLYVCRFRKSIWKMLILKLKR